NYAFLKAEPTLGGVHQTSCAIFGQPGNALRFERVDALGASGEAAKAEGNTIFLYNTAKNRNRHTAANMIHEIGHYINAKLGGAILDGIPNLNSPLGQLRDGKLKLANGTDFSGQIVALDKARDGMQP
ncbi:MAG TPA: hypothetical protein PLZ51_26885, partial [Aggregatilineales bacterium]|nr:hypothetical protein [Aggregatilineales bacterium]